MHLFSPRGTPVLSTTEGVAVRIGKKRLGGKTVSVLEAAAEFIITHISFVRGTISHRRLPHNGITLGTGCTTVNLQNKIDR